MIGLMVENVGLCLAKSGVEERKTRLENWRALEMISIAKLIKIKVLLFQFSHIMFNTHHIWLFS